MECYSLLPEMASFWVYVGHIVIKRTYVVSSYSRIDILSTDSVSKTQLQKAESFAEMNLCCCCFIFSQQEDLSALIVKMRLSLVSCGRDRLLNAYVWSDSDCVQEDKKREMKHHSAYFFCCEGGATEGKPLASPYPLPLLWLTIEGIN